MSKIKIIISDFQYLTRAGLIHLISELPHFELLSVVEHQDELLESLHQNQPDVLVLDYQKDDQELLKLLKEIVGNRSANVCIVTNENRKTYIQDLLDIGIKGIVTKGCSQQEILNAIESVSRDSRFYCNKILDTLIEREEDNPENCEPTELSPREFEVLQLITKGLKTAQIADSLNVSVHTINSHRKNILKKLNLRSPAELIVYAMESGLVKS